MYLDDDYGNAGRMLNAYVYRVFMKTKRRSTRKKSHFSPAHKFSYEQKYLKKSENQVYKEKEEFRARGATTRFNWARKKRNAARWFYGFFLYISKNQFKNVFIRVEKFIINCTLYQDQIVGRILSKLRIFL